MRGHGSPDRDDLAVRAAGAYGEGMVGISLPWWTQEGLRDLAATNTGISIVLAVLAIGIVLGRRRTGTPATHPSTSLWARLRLLERWTPRWLVFAALSANVGGLAGLGLLSANLVDAGLVVALLGLVAALGLTVFAGRVRPPVEMAVAPDIPPETPVVGPGG